MKRRLLFLFSVFTSILFLNLFMFGQETTGSIEVTVRDAAGAVVPNATVTIANSSKSTTTGGFKRTVTTSDDGIQRILQVPSGIYSVTVGATSGFAEKTTDGIQVVLGRTTPVTVELGTQVGAVVDVTADTSPIDTTDSKIQTNITAQTAELLPKGTNFSSLLKISPAVRQEQGNNFQIDGSSGSENTFIIDGHEVTNARTGVLNDNSNLPFSLVQEVQIKSSGFEAEYGGATGGVVNVVTKSGGDEFHGEVGTSFSPSKLQATSSGTLFLNAAGTTEYIPNRRDQSLGNFPSVTLGGPIVKGRLWFFGNYSPQFFNTTRTIDYYTDAPGRSYRTSQTYSATQRDEYASGRLDAQPYSKLHLSGRFTWSPTAVTGAVPAYSSLFDSLPTNGTLTGAPYYSQLGGRQNSSDTSGEATWTPFNSLIINIRGGHNFLNEKLGTYGLPDVTTPRILCSASSPSAPPANFGCIRGQSNGVDIFSNTIYDATRRDTFDAQATVLTSFGGRHEFKGGYQWNRIKNNLLSQQNDYILLRFGQSLSAMSGRNVDSAANAIGAGFVQVYEESGNVSGNNTGLFIQDKWQPFSRLTLNVGVRAEKETVPSFTPGLPGLNFGWGSKITPRIGVAYDLFGDGKTKISGFYGQFNDRFKYELPRGSFGGAYYHTLYFDILASDAPYTSLTTSKILGNYVYTPGGKCPQTGIIGGRVRCDVDARIPSNAGLGLEAGALDPDIKPMRTTEITFTAEHQLSRDYFISGRYTRKKLDRAIEDIGFLTSEGSEAYVIGNPGLGLAAQVAQDNGLLPVKAERTYDALEVRLDKRLSDNFAFGANYTYSRLIGNYSGLASTDEGGRNAPNVNRYFDLPFYGFAVAGGPDNGKLATDRPHVFKFSGSYTTDWAKRFGFGTGNSTDFKLFTTVQSGTPLTSVVDIIGITTVTLNKRGDLGRTPVYKSTDFGISHHYRFGSDNRFSITGDIDVLNIFNEHNVLGVYNLVSQDNFDLTDPALGLVTAAESLKDNAYAIAIGRFQRNGAPTLLNLINSKSSQVNFDKRFGLPNSFQSPRSIRFGFRFQF